MKILIIDDSDLDRTLMVRNLLKAEIPNEILEASNGEQGLKLLRENYDQICLVIVDISMPKMTGLEFMQEVVQEPALVSIPIVIVSVSGSEQTKQRARSINPSLAGFVTKPYKLESLLEVIQPYLQY